MTQEEKQLLLKDLCTRLPYGIKVAIELSKGKYTRVYDLREIDNDSTAELRQQVTVWDYGFYSSVISYPLIDCRPYLRPMSSMTKEEEEELRPLKNQLVDCDENNEIKFYNIIDEIHRLYLSHNIDFMGLIPKGLALEAPEGMYKFMDK